MQLPHISGYARRCIVTGAASLALAVLFAITPLARVIDLGLGDVLISLSAPPDKFDDVVVIDIDEPSMARLEPQIGAWPYDRDIYGLVNAYLTQAGVAVAAYDILFSEARNGDDAFAATLTPKTVLAAAALPYGGAAHDPDYRKRLARAAWARGTDWPAHGWDDLTLPIPKFSAAAQVGVISVKPDPDGVLRGVPLLHRAYGEVLPSLAPVVLKASGVSVEMDQAERRILIDGRAVPVDDTGLARLRYPRNWRGLRVVPFYEVALAASGAPEYAALAATLRGKTVYIGSSSAILGDFVQTPIGRVAGLYMLSVLPSMLKNGMVLHPRHWLLDGLLMLFMLAGALAMAHPQAQRMTWLQVAGLPALLLLTAAAVAALALAGRSAAVLLPALAGGIAHLGALLWRQVYLFHISQRLLVEKLSAEESARLKTQFLSHMTHELRTPLTAIMGFNNINWRSAELGREQRIKNGEIIDRNGRHLLALINSILDQAKLEAGQVRIVTQPESVRALVGDVVATMQPLVRDKPVKLTAVYSDRVPDVLDIDAFRIRQILLNMAGNAIKFTDRGSVTLTVDWADGTLSIEVADTGPGMSPEGLSRLFVAFQQADDKVASTHGGTGLGLTISRDLATLMSGAITVASELGVGSRFTLRLPASAAALAEPDPAPVAVEPPPSAGQTPVVAGVTAGAATVPGRPVPVERATGADLLHGTVLVAEDTDDLRTLTVMYLKRLGLNVLEAVNGQAAVDIAIREHPDAILMDLEMPVLHGLEAVKALRAHGFAAPILAMTAHNSMEQRELCQAAGCNDMLSKPVSRAGLRAALDGALSAQRPA